MNKNIEKSVFFFFQAEDGIRDYKVTGVQTCALPILADGRSLIDEPYERRWQALTAVTGGRYLAERCLVTSEAEATSFRDRALAARDGETFADVGKTFKGFTDAQFVEMTERLSKLATADDGYTVRVRPEVVVEVEYNEIQRSPTYRSGLALRFARIAR